MDLKFYYCFTRVGNSQLTWSNQVNKSTIKYIKHEKTRRPHQEPSRKTTSDLLPPRWKMLEIDGMGEPQTMDISQENTPGNRSGTPFAVSCRQHQRWLTLHGWTVRIHRKRTSMIEYRYVTCLETLQSASASFDNVRQWSAKCSRCKLF